MEERKYRYTNMEIHSLVSGLVKRAGTQRVIADVLGLNQATFSVWLTGKGAMRVCQEVESIITNWLSKFDSNAVLALSGEHEVPAEQQMLLKFIFKPSNKAGIGDGLALTNYGAGLVSNKRGPKTHFRSADGMNSSEFAKLSQQTGTPLPDEDDFLGHMKQLMKYVMALQGLNQGQLAEAIQDSEENMSQGTVSAWFRGALQEKIVARVSKKMAKHLKKYQKLITHDEDIELLRRTLEWSDSQKVPPFGGGGRGRKKLSPDGASPSGVTANYNSNPDFDSSAPAHSRLRAAVKEEDQSGDDGSDEDTGMEVEQDGDDTDGDDEQKQSNPSDGEGGESSPAQAAAPYAAAVMSGSSSTKTAPTHNLLAMLTAKSHPVSTVSPSPSAPASSDCAGDHVGAGVGVKLEGGGSVSANSSEDVEQTPYDDTRISQLQASVSDEMLRRKLTQHQVRNEAGLFVAQAALSKFLISGVPAGEGKGSTMLKQLSEWLKFSFLKNAYNSSEVKEKDKVKYCEFCNTPSSTFNSQAGFSRHVAWCLRRQKIANGIEVAPFKRKHSGNQGQSEKEEWSSDDGRYKRLRNSNDVLDVSEMTGMTSNIIKADILDGSYNNYCEKCRGGGTVVVCNTCPSVYHFECATPILQAAPVTPWVCHLCDEARVLGASRVDTSQPGPKRPVWVALYSKTLKRWRVAAELGRVPARNLLLIKWLRSDGKGGRLHWVDCSEAKVLTPLMLNNDLLPHASSDVIRAAFDEIRVRRNTDLPSSSVAGQRGGIATSDNGEKKRKQGRPIGRQGDSHSHGQDGPRGSGVPAEKATTSMSDTYVSGKSLSAALSTAGTACQAVDTVMCGHNTNAFVCTRPPGHHAGRYGCTAGCLSTGFCMLNNAAIAATYARVRWGLERVAVVDIDVHFGNGTAELLRGDPRAFFASVHMVYGKDNMGNMGQEGEGAHVHSSATAGTSSRGGKDDGEDEDPRDNGFYPAELGGFELSPTYVSVGVLPEGDTPRPSPVASPTTAPAGSALSMAVDELAGAEAEASAEDMAAQEVADLWSAISDEEKERYHEMRRSSGGAVGAEGSGMSSLGASAAKVLDTPGGSRSYALFKNERYPAVLGRIQGELDAAQSVQRQARLKELMSGGKSDPGRFVGAAGYRRAIEELIIPSLINFDPELLIISAGFDGFTSDPLGGELQLSLDDYIWTTRALLQAVDTDRVGAARSCRGRVVSLLEGGYDTSATLGLAHCVDAHVRAMRVDGGIAPGDNDGFLQEEQGDGEDLEQEEEREDVGDDDDDDDEDPDIVSETDEDQDQDQSHGHSDNEMEEGEAINTSMRTSF